MIPPTAKRKQILLCGGCSLWGLSVLSRDESGLKQVHIISGTLSSRGDALSQAPSDIFPCHFTFFTGLKSFLLWICRGCLQSHCLKWQEEGLVVLGMSEPVPSASSQTAWECCIITSSSLGRAKN